MSELSFVQHFSVIRDPRKNTWLQRHELYDILVIAICGVLCGADSFEDIHLFAKCKEDWLKTFLKLPNGLPSHDTIRRIFTMLSPNQFQKAFFSWTKAMSEGLEETIIAIDGKTARGSFDKEKGKKAIHMVSAWACANNIVLGQMKVNDKSNEITAIPKLLELLEIKGAIVTIDAMGCQKGIAKGIIEKKGDYVLSLKGNQGTMLEDTKLAFDGATPEVLTSRMSDYFETIEKGHGRIETRKYWITDEIDFLSLRDEWIGLSTLGIVESTREIDGKTSKERRYFIASIPPSASKLAEAVRGHWAVENNLHWVLDVVFNEDKSRIRSGHAAENFNTLRKLTLGMIKKENSKGSLKGKRKRAGWDNTYLMKLLKPKEL